MPGQAHTRTDNIEMLKNEVRLDCLAAGEFVIEHHIQRTIIDFCQRSQYWQEDVGPVQVVAGIDTYEVSASRTERVVQVKQVWTEDDTGMLVKLEYGRGLPRWSWYHDSPFDVTVAPLDDLEGRQLIVIAALAPELYNNQFKFSRLVTDHYFDAIASGAKARIMAIPDKEWTNLQLAGVHSQIYETAVNAALVIAGRDHAAVPHRVAQRARDFF